MTSCKIGVSSPTTKFAAQFDAVDNETPLALKASGIISGGYNPAFVSEIEKKRMKDEQGIGPHE